MLLKKKLRMQGKKKQIQILFFVLFPNAKRVQIDSLVFPNISVKSLFSVIKLMISLKMGSVVTRSLYSQVTNETSCQIGLVARCYFLCKDQLRKGLTAQASILELFVTHHNFVTELKKPIVIIRCHIYLLWR